jgi:hypothetical protein
LSEGFFCLKTWPTATFYSTEDYVHFLLKCDTLSTLRYSHLVRLALYLEKIQVNTDYLVNSEKDLLQLIIDCSASNLIDSQYTCQNSSFYYSLFDVSFVVSDAAPTQIWLFIFPCICFHITQRWLCFLRYTVDNKI